MSGFTDMKRQDLIENTIGGYCETIQTVYEMIIERGVEQGRDQLGGNRKYHRFAWQAARDEHCTRSLTPLLETDRWSAKNSNFCFKKR